MRRSQLGEESCWGKVIPGTDTEFRAGGEQLQLAGEYNGKALKVLRRGVNGSDYVLRAHSLGAVWRMDWRWVKRSSRETS